MAKFDHTLRDNFEYLGEWWLPQEPSRRFGGRLSYVPTEGATLSLIGSFIESPQVDTFQVDLVHGFTVEGHACTLWRGFGLRWNDHSPGIANQSIRFELLLVGHHFATEDAIAFTHYQVVYAGLDEWLGQYPISSKLGSRDDIMSFAAEYNPPDIQQYELPERNGTLHFEYNATSEFGRLYVSIRSEPVLRFAPLNACSYEWYRKTFLDFERFLILMMGHVTSPQRISASISEEEPMVGIYPQVRLQARDDVARHVMMLTQPMLVSQLPTLLPQWCQIADQLRPVMDIFFGTLYQANMYLQIKFLALMQSIEGFHRATRTGNFKLRKRLDDLFDSLSTDLQESITSNADTFFESIVKTRDYYTHYIPKLASERLSDRELVGTCSTLRVFMTILLLKELGFSDDTALTAIERLRKHLLPRSI